MLSESKNIMLGDTPVSRIYKGTTIVWQRFSLEEYGLAPNSSDPNLKTMPIKVMSISSGSEAVTDLGSDTRYPTSSGITRWYDYTDVLADNASIGIYSEGRLPPAIFVPYDGAVTQNGVNLPRDFYILISKTELLTSKAVITYRIRGFSIFYNSRYGYDEFNFCHAYDTNAIGSSGFTVSLRKTFYAYNGEIRSWLSVYVSGVEHNANEYYFDGRSLSTLIESLSSN